MSEQSSKNEHVPENLSKTCLVHLLNLREHAVKVCHIR